MTRPRLYPDRPRVTPEECAWVIAAKAAGATIWQCAVFVQRKADTLYRVVARGEPTKPKKRKPRGPSLRDIERKERTRFKRETRGAMFRCRCGGPAGSPDGHERCRAA